MLAALLLVLGQYQPSIVSHQGRPNAVDGGAWPVLCVNCSASPPPPSVVWLDGGLVHAVVDSLPPVYFADGGVTVNNFPAVQATTLTGQPAVFVGFDAGYVSVANFPATQPISAVSLPTHAVTQSGSWTTQSEAHVAFDGGFVSVMNFPSTQVVTVPLNPVVNAFVAFDAGFVSVANFPATQPVSLASVPTHAVTLASTTLTGTSAVSLATLPALTAGSAVIGHTISDTGSTTAVTGTVTVSGTVTANAGTGTQAVSLATAPTTPVTGTFWQATQPVSLASAPTTAVTNAGLTNLDVALSTRTKPADQQHTIIDSSAAIAVTGPATDAQLRATPLPVSGTVAVSALGGSVAVTGTFWQATQPVSGSVSVSNFPASQAVTGTFFQATQPVSIASMPSTPVTGVFYQATQPISAVGPDGGTTLNVSGSSVSVVAMPAPLPNPFPLNPFLPRCNPVRRTGCQP